MINVVFLIGSLFIYCYCIHDSFPETHYLSHTVLAFVATAVNRLEYSFCAQRMLKGSDKVVTVSQSFHADFGHMFCQYSKVSVSPP